jgi:capsular exopolysaccharide synthesis family protein
MSRFYDALKEARRSHPKPDGNSGEDEWDFGTSGAAVPVLQPETNESSPEREIPEPPLDSLHDDLLNLAAIPRKVGASSNDAPRAKVEIAFDPKARLLPHAADPVVVEHYRRLRTKILQQHAAKPFRSLVITSPSPQEGKTVTVLNLGLSFAMLPNFKVLVIDGDLRRGSIGKWLGVGDHPGLSNLLDGSARLDDVVVHCSDVPLHFVMRGNSKASPAELLHSPQLGSQFREMTENFNLVLVDSPPVNLLTDAQLLAGSCDAVLLIARAFSTTRKSFEQAAHDLSSFRMIGTVLNGGTRAQLNRRYHGYY